MNQLNDAVRDHYQAAITDESALLRNIANLIDKMEGPLTAERFAGFDQFHVGGLMATEQLATRAGIKAGDKILDAGSGLGGPSRYLAAKLGCSVRGVDIAPAYVAIAELISQRAGLDTLTRYQVGSITALPFDNSSFDLVWTQHVVMNISDRAKLYSEVRRVLRPGGKFVFYDPYAPDEKAPLYYPVPWAETAASSTLLTKTETIAAMKQAGLALSAWDDVTPLGLNWLAAQQQQIQQAMAVPPGEPILQPGLVVGARMREMVGNFGRNLMEAKVSLVMGICIAE